MNGRAGLTDEAPAPGKIRPPSPDRWGVGAAGRPDDPGPRRPRWDRTGPPGPREMDEMILYRNGIMQHGYATMTDRPARW